MDVRPLRPQPWTVRAPRSSSPDEVRPADTPFRGMLLTGDLITAPTSFLQRDVTPRHDLSLPPPNRPAWTQRRASYNGRAALGAGHGGSPHSFIHSFASLLHTSAVPGASAHPALSAGPHHAVRRVPQATAMGLPGPATSDPSWGRPSIALRWPSSAPQLSRLRGNPERDRLGSGVFAEVIG